MLTYGNGEMLSKLLHNAINRSCIRRLKSCCSKAKDKKKKPLICVPKDGVHVKTFPPLGDTMRDMFDSASSSQSNPWRMSDIDRHAREIQSVTCDGGIFAQDHAFEAIKNCQKRVGAKAAWTVGTGTGEIAAVALVPSTKTIDFAHAAKQLMCRPGFKPKAMHSDTWPSKNTFWQMMSPGMEGRLGSFHCEQRIIATMRKKHVDCSEAVTDLLACICTCHVPDCEKLLDALKSGKFSKGHKCTSSEIADLKSSRQFRDRHAKCLRKQMHPPQTMIQKLDDWFCKCKVTSSEPETRPARGRLDPVRMVALFTADTKAAVENCKLKAKHLKDPLPLHQVCDEMPAHPKSKHQLSEFLSKRGESKLESCHDRLAHFANCGMRDTLADNLNLAGTARHNLSIRHKRSFLTPEKTAENPSEWMENRLKTPAAWEKVAPCFNHTELSCVNAMANAVGCGAPFPHAEPLPSDNGEKFFSQCMTTLKQISKKRGQEGECLCELCDGSGHDFPVAPTPPRMKNTQQQTAVTTVVVETTNNQQTIRQPTAAAAPPQQQRLCKTVTHTPVGAPAAFASIAPHCHPQQFFFHPMVCCYPPVMPPVAPAPCCTKHREWLTVRKGRPPHHPLCSNR